MFMLHPQQLSVLDKFRQDFRNNHILWKYDKSSSVPQQQQKQSPSEERFRNTCWHSKIYKKSSKFFSVLLKISNF